MTPPTRQDRYRRGDKVEWLLPVVMQNCRTWAPDLTKEFSIIAVRDAPGVRPEHCQLVRVAPNYSPYGDEFSGGWFKPIERPSSFPETRAAVSRLSRNLRNLLAAIRQGRAQALILRGLGVDPTVLTRLGWIRLTSDELTWLAARAGVIDHEAISSRPRPDELTAEGLLVLREKLTVALERRG